jgi:hypothetical protein
MINILYFFYKKEKYKIIYMKEDIVIKDKRIYNFAYNFIEVFGWITKIVIFLFLIGFFQNKPTLYLNINFIIKILIALFMIYRFNSYRKYKIQFTELDRKASFSAGVYILFISFADIFEKYIYKIRKIIYPYTKTFDDFMISHIPVSL